MHFQRMSTVFNRISCMKIINNITEWKTKRNTLGGKFTELGFVPTMGNLHKGHLSLIERSISENDFTVVSIFVNPTQFDNVNDLKNYPRTLDDDITKLRELNCDILYAPEKDDLYKNSYQAKKYDFNGLENEMEGKHRPGHFNGVATIVEKLFNIINPTYAYFGQKDLQQLQTI